jgi:uncharacterized repeat protein (TIGR03803 family)
MFPLNTRVGTMLLAAAAALFAGSMVRAQTYTVLHAFTGPDGSQPQGGVIQASDGNFYGTTYGGSLAGIGSVFKVDQLGHFTTLHSFVGTDGAFPQAGLIQGDDGNFYGTTTEGGAISCSGFSFGCGTVFRMDSVGDLTTLHTFDGIDGATPISGLVQASDGSFYGTTSSGGTIGHGTVFRMDSSGNLGTLHDFLGGPDDGSQPTAGLIQATDGNLYGTSLGGGTVGSGTIFKVDLAGHLTILHSFAGSEGAQPWGGLTQGRDGNFYGTAMGGGGVYPLGTAFRMDPSGNVTALHTFAPVDGIQPYGVLTEAADGDIYGTTTTGGIIGYGTIFKLDPQGNFMVVHGFTGADGNSPLSGVILAADGSLYGTTSGGGMNNSGVIYRLPMTGCVPDAFTLCLNNGRFEVRTQWTDFQGNQGSGNVVLGVSSSDSGLFWFFGPTNWEVLIKVLNGCGVNSHYWVFGAASTNVQYTIQVTDTVSGAVNYYTNPLGTSSPAITDTAAFGSCP